MEHRAPRRPVFGLTTEPSDLLPIVEDDALRFLIRTKRMPVEEAKGLLAEAVKTVRDVEDYLHDLRDVDQAIRRYREGDPEVRKACSLALLESRRDGLIRHGYILSARLRYPRFGRYLPQTRRRLKRKVQYAVRKSIKQKCKWAGNCGDLLQLLCGPPPSEGFSPETRLGQSAQTPPVVAQTGK